MVGRGTWPANRRRFMMNFLLNAVTNLVLRSGPVAKRWELSLVLPNRRDRQVAVSEGLIELFTEPAKTKDLPAACMQGIKNVG